jgi:hypothetical protein
MMWIVQTGDDVPNGKVGMSYKDFLVRLLTPGNGGFN